MAKKPNNRLGAGKFARNEIQTHPFYNIIDWDSAAEKGMEPPIIPMIVSLIFLSLKTKYGIISTKTYFIETSQGSFEFR